MGARSWTDLIIFFSFAICLSAGTLPFNFFGRKKMLDKAVRLKLLLIVAAQLLHVCDSYFEFSTCYNSTNYTINSNFAMNLNRLFSTLTSNAPATGFYTDAVGQGVDRVYGLILCRGDLSAGDCGNCATTAPMELMKLCPRRRRGTIWYDECFLRYKDSNFIGNVTMDPGFCMWKLANNSDPILFDHQAGQLMRSLSASVLSNRTGLMFASGDISFGDYNTIYGVAQCTRDISRDDCSQCLAGRISRIPERCEGKVGCIVYNGNCGVRYEIYPFVYNAAASQQPSSPSPAMSPPVPTMAPQETKPSPTLFNTTSRSASHGLRRNAIVLIALLCSSVFLLCIISVLSVARRSKRGKAPDEDEMKGTTPSVFHMDTLKAATNNFSEVNKLGQGGFGPVYKGTLEDGTQVAVKRLSEKSTQGPAQFKNEVNLVAKLHHRNLARLLGYYLDEQERLLVYEFVPSGSLDKILFDPTKRQQLDWGKRLQIINGIGRGLLYLHEDSQLMIIHRDLKAGNVLLDEEMNPKISDFGLAKLFQVEGTHATTENVAGTRGYMSPEYAMNGIFSVKSDVFSFGVLVLEILSGRRNTSFYQSELAPDLLTYAWKLWQDGRALDLVDQAIDEPWWQNQILRCIVIGLLCVQEAPKDRPTMSKVVLMLVNSSMILPTPSPPAYFTSSPIPKSSETARSGERPILSSRDKENQNSGGLTISDLHPR